MTVRSFLLFSAGLLAPAEGRAERAPCVLADEQAALDANWTLADALGFWARLDGTDAAQGLHAFGLAPLARLPVRMLSTGQRKRAVLARVAASGAPLWLLDEPTNGLDAEGVEEVVIVGAMSHMCIDATTRAAADLGYKATVVHDACATRDLEFAGQTVPAAQVHAANMAALAWGYGQVVGTRELLAQ